MAKITCQCGSSGNFSIHGNCNNCGKPCSRVYNSSTVEPQEPTTARGKRRRENKKNG